MAADDFAAFKAAHPDPAAAVEACQRPDWLIELGWTSGADRKQVLSVGAMLASVLTSSNLRDFVPWPERLDAVRAWVGDAGEPDRTELWRRAGTLGSVFGAVLGGVLTWALSRGRSEEFQTNLAVWLTFGGIALCTFIARALLQGAERRAVARLDETRAHDLVMAELSRGMRLKPASVPTAMKFFRKRIAALLPKRFEWPNFDTPQPLEGTRAWTGTFDSYDQHHERCFYRLRLLDGGQPVTEFMAEIGTGFGGDDWTTPAFHAELLERLAEVARSGQSNSSWQP
ncbi:MAG: hypothetical protein U0228_03650 [Myxococcaceae bacterium]